MTGIKDMLMAWRSKQSKKLNNADSVSFNSFGNESPLKHSPKKETSLTSFAGDGDAYRGDTCKLWPSQQAKNTTINLQRGILLLLGLFACITCYYVTLVLLGYTIHIVPANRSHSRINSDKYSTTQPTISNHYKPRALPNPPKPDVAQCKLIPNDHRFDCLPQDGATPEACQVRGCCWSPPQNRRYHSKKKPAHKSGPRYAPLDVPYCYYPSNYQGYNFLNVTQTVFGAVAFLGRKYGSGYPGDVGLVKMTVKYESESRLRVKFTDPGCKRFEPPYPEVPIVDRAASSRLYRLEFDAVDEGFRVVRISDNTTIFDASRFISTMIFSEQFLQLSANLPSTAMYGIGEHRTHLQLSTKWSRFTMFNHDMVPTENNNLYGSHPFYLNVESSGNSNGVFLLNSNAMDIILQPTPAITFRTIGGVLDFYFFLGPTPSAVISQYTEVIGKPFMPPYWGLGFHLCRFGYKSLNQTRQVWKRTVDAGIPLDTQWNDLDYMDRRNDFTYDRVLFKGLPQFVKELHKSGMHYIPLIDPGVSGSEKPGTYPPFDKGIEMDIFVKNASGQPFTGKVWNLVNTVWPDFTNPQTVDYWTQMLKSLHVQVPFDGAWIDMNEPSNMISGSFTGCPKHPLENPPYLPSVDGGKLSYKTVCMTARHFAGTHYDVHNLYGLTEAIVTSFAMAEIRGRRPMVISRSTFPGLGQYAGHWGGDVFSKWYDMKYTIQQMLNFNMFGIPLMGADICGFNGNTTASLCNRWMQLGAFYPFSRNHNTDDGIDQDPVAMGPLVIKSSKKALQARYSLLPYLYTLFWAAHVQGETVARPLFFEFTSDFQTHTIDDQFLWGAAIMITPVLEENVVSLTPYFPEGLWYDFYAKASFESKGQRFNISAPLDTIPVFVRGGYIIPQQSPLQTTTQSRKSKLQLLAASDSSEQGCGQLYWDDGDSLNSFEEQRYTLLQFTLKSGELRSEPVWWGSENPPNLGRVTVLGVKDAVTEVTINQVSQPFQYDAARKYLLIANLDVSLKSPVVVLWK